jgi:uncharacterized protein
MAKHGSKRGGDRAGHGDGRDARGGALGPRVATTGSGRAERAADLAQATFVVEGIRDTAAEARSVAAEAATAVFGALEGAGLDAADVRTAGIDVTPNWDHEDGHPVRRGFTVTNRIGATIRDLERVGTVLDAALGAGATGLDGVSFGLAEPGPAATEARRLAVEDARGRAETIAAAAGMRLGALVSLVEGSPGMPMPRPEMRMAAMAADSFAPTPVLPGSIEVAVSVAGEWELVPG